MDYKSFEYTLKPFASGTRPGPAMQCSRHPHSLTSVEGTDRRIPRLMLPATGRRQQSRPPAPADRRSENHRRKGRDRKHRAATRQSDKFLCVNWNSENFAEHRPTLEVGVIQAVIEPQISTATNSVAQDSMPASGTNGPPPTMAVVCELSPQRPQDLLASNEASRIKSTAPSVMSIRQMRPGPSWKTQTKYRVFSAGQPDIASHVQQGTCRHFPAHARNY